MAGIFKYRYSSTVILIYRNTKKIPEGEESIESARYLANIRICSRISMRMLVCFSCSYTYMHAEKLGTYPDFWRHSQIKTFALCESALQRAFQYDRIYLDTHIWNEIRSWLLSVHCTVSFSSRLACRTHFNKDKRAFKILSIIENSIGISDLNIDEDKM